MTARTEPSAAAGRSSWGWWLRSGGWAIVDQALFAGTYFAVNVLLARWLTPSEFGAFALAYALFLLVSVFHTAWLTEPMMVFGAGKYAAEFPRYLCVLLCGHAALTLTVAMVLAGVALLLGSVGSSAVPDALLGLSLGLPFLLLPWLLRRTFYVRRGPHVAAAGGALHLLVVLVALHATFRLGALSGRTAFLVLALGGLLAGLATSWFWHLAGRVAARSSRPRESRPTTGATAAGPPRLRCSSGCAATAIIRCWASWSGSKASASSRR